MRSILGLIALSLIITGLVYAQEPGADGIGDPYYPQLGNGGYDALHYTLDLKSDLANRTLSASVKMTAQATQDLHTFNLDFIGFTIQHVTVNDVAATFERSHRELIVTPSAPLHHGDTFTVTVSYDGSPDVVESSITPERVGWIDYDGGVFAMSNPDGAEAWFPVNNHPLDKATYTFRITVPEPYVAVANGILQDTIVGDGSITYVWEAREPVGSQVTTVAIGKFVSNTIEGPDGLPIRYYYPPEIEVQFATRFEMIPDMIAFYTSVLGPYPFEAYGVTAGCYNTAHEAQMMQLFSPEQISATFPPEEYIAHELAHQWFGNSLSVARWQDIWLGEGFAGYAAWLWLEHTYGADELQRMIHQRYLRASYPPYPVLPGSPPPEDLFYWDDFVYFYDRGALTLHALRLQIGDDVFFDILQTYTAAYQYGNVTVDDFIAVAEEVSEKELDSFFDAWLYEDDMPPIPELGLS